MVLEVVVVVVLGDGCGGGEGVFALCAGLCSGHVQVLVYCVVVMPLQCLCTQCSLCELQRSDI